MKLSIIAATDRKNAIGKENSLPWRLPADLKNFKALTDGKLIIMGRKTWESLGSKSLPNRQSIVITRDHTRVTENSPNNERGVIIAPNLADAIGCAEALVKQGTYPDEVFIIGGSEVYHQTIKKADRIYVSRVDTVVEGADAFFPDIDRDYYQQSMSVRHLKDDAGSTYDWHYQIWDKIRG